MRLPLRVGVAAVAATTVVTGVGLTAATAAASSVAVSGNVPSFATATHKTGSVPTTAKLTISVYLTPRNASGLAKLARDVSSPGSASYGHYLTPAQFHAAYSPAAADVTAVKNFLTGSGLKVDAVAGNNGYVDATGTVSQVEKALQVTQSTYAVDGQAVRSNAEAPKIPAALAGKVFFIGGLDSVQDLLKPAAQAPVAVAPVLPCNTTYPGTNATVTPAIPDYGASLPFANCGYDPDHIRQAYGLPPYRAGQTNAGFTGKGVRVGIVDAFASPYEPADLNKFSVNHHLPSGSDLDYTSIVAPGTFNEPVNKKHDPSGWYGEETLDLDAVHSIAPEASLVYAGSPNNQMPLDHALTKLIDGHLVDVVTNSWGFTGEPAAPGYFHADEVAFQQAAIEGITVLFSTGDDGDVGALRGLAQASWPASSDFVTAVGGTSLLSQGNGSRQEFGWGTYFSNLKAATLDGTTLTHDGTESWPPAFLFGSGGGASPHVAQPWYQQGKVGALGNSAVTYDANGPSGTVTYSQPRRVVPDIAMDADPYTGLLIGETFTVSNFKPDNFSQDGSACVPEAANTEYCESSIGGTSLASPLMAGVVALVDQARLGHRPTVGFLNPALYDGTASAGVVDVTAPGSPTGFVRTRQVSTGNGLSARFVTVNSTVDGNDNVVEGADTSLRTAPGYDDVTGWGTPDVPAFIAALG